MDAGVSPRPCGSLVEWQLLPKPLPEGLPDQGASHEDDDGEEASTESVADEFHG